MSKTNWRRVEQDGKDRAHAKEVAALKQNLEHAVAQIERLEQSRRAKIIAATPPRKRDKGDLVRVVIPDTHGAKADSTAVGAMLGDIKTLNPDEVILLGDHVDCGGHLAQHHVLGYVAETSYSYEDDIAATNAFLDALRAAAPNARIEYIEGNHECLTADHEALTRRGWVPISEVTKEDEVATLGWGNITEWQRPTELIRKHFKGELFVSDDTPFFRARMTPGHRVAYFGRYLGDLRYREAKDVFSTDKADLAVPVSGLGLRHDLPGYSDDELRLLGWILTDGCISGGFFIYQSKPDRIEQIHGLLKRLGLEYSFTVREAKAKEIDGVPIKTRRPAGVFRIAAASHETVMRVMGLSSWHYSDRPEKRIPEYVRLLSHRQFGVLLEAIIHGDGHSTSSKAATIYGAHGFLSELQGLCVVNGVRACLRLKTRKGQPSHSALYVVRTPATRICGRMVRREQADCEVFCITVPNSNFFVRHGGSVHVTGNCRVEAWCITQTLRHSKDAEGLRRLYAPEFRLFLAQRGIAYYRQGEFYDGLPVPGVIKRGKCYFTHGFSTAKAAAAATVESLAGNVAFGHTHRAESVIMRKVGAGVIGGWNPGCLCNLQPLWQHTNPTTWTHGFGVQIQDQSGDFIHLNIPVIGGKSLFTALVRL